MFLNYNIFYDIFLHFKKDNCFQNITISEKPFFSKNFGVIIAGPKCVQKFVCSKNRDPHQRL